MAELTPIPSTQQQSGPAYQPVSGYVVAAGIATLVFVVFLLIIGYYAVSSRRSVLSEELLLLPILGIILSILGRSHVRNSDGTKTGMSIANFCWWVCVLGGAGFVSYLLANDYAIQRQSNRFVEQDYFKEMRAGKIQHAFKALVPAEERERAPAVEPEGKDAESARARDYFEAVYQSFGYQDFKHSDVTRLLLRNAKAFEVEHLGTKDVGQEEAGLKATQLYRIKCPEGVFELAIKTQAIEGRKGGAARWRIAGPNAVRLTPVEISKYGLLAFELEQEADSFGRLWMAHLTFNRPTIGHLLTVPLEQRKDLELRFGRMMMLGGAPATSLELGPDWLPEARAKKWQARAADKQSPTAFDELQDLGFFRSDDLGSPLSADGAAKLKSIWSSPHILSPSQRPSPGPAGPPPASSVMDFSPDKVTARVPVDVYSDGRVRYFRATLLLECTQPDVLAALNAARERGYADKADGVGLRNLPVRDWRVVGLIIDMTPQDPSPPKQGGPPMPGMRPGG